MSENTDTQARIDDDTMRIAARMTLNEITSRADDLRRNLEDARNYADRALEEMVKGQRVSGSWSNGPLGHQLPFDIARSTHRLEAALEQAQMYRHMGFFTDAEIEAAYLAGAKAGR